MVLEARGWFYRQGDGSRGKGMVLEARGMVLEARGVVLEARGWF